VAAPEVQVVLVVWVEMEVEMVPVAKALAHCQAQRFDVPVICARCQTLKTGAYTALCHPRTSKSDIWVPWCRVRNKNLHRRQPLC